MLNKAKCFSAISRRRCLRGILAFSSIPSFAIQSKGGELKKATIEKQAAPWLSLPPTPTLPRSSRQGLASINGVKIFYAQFGQGPAMLFLHGGLANSNYWGNQISVFSRNFSVTVMDTRGHGRSPFISDKFSYELFADDAVSLLNYLDISRTIVIGWSDGAITALQLAMTRPDRLSGLFAFGANSNLEGLKAGGSHTGAFPTFSARCRQEYSALSPTPNRWPELERGLGRMWRREPMFTRAQLHSIKLTTTISAGEYDEIIRPEDTRQMAQSINGAHLSILPRVSHFAMLQDPSQFNDAIRGFLSDIAFQRR